MEITVVGAGCLGLSAALALAEDGHDVTVCDRSQPGSESTAKAAGICSTMTRFDDDYELIARTRGLIGELISLAAGPVPQARGAWRSHDSITIAPPYKQPVLDDLQHRLERNTEEPERLAWRQAQAAFPALEWRPGDEALVAQEDGVIDAGDWLDAMLWRLDSEGVEMEVGAVHERPAAEAVVVAAGAWTRSLLAAWGHDVPVQHFRTQAASIQVAGADEIPIFHDLGGGFYGRPESEGSIIAGDGTRLSDHDPDAYDERGGPRFHEDIATGLTNRLRDGATASIRRSWAGLCVATPDTRPLCGAVAGSDDLFVLTGDNGFGLMRSMALGERLAEAVDGADMGPLDPSRFGDVEHGWAMREGFAL